MRGNDARSSLIGLGGLMIGGSLLLAHCGGGDNSSGNDDGGSDGAQDATSGDTSLPNDGSGEATTDATVDTGEDGGSEPDATPDAGPDAAPEAGADASPDAPPDATPEGGDAGDAGDGGAEAEAGPARIPCDVDAQAPCTGGATVQCCGGFCTDTATDPTNCGHCGVGCTSHQFCTGTECDDAIIANVCKNPRGTVVLDPYGPDNEGGIELGAALVTSCVPVPTIVQRSQDEAGVLEPGTDRPITGVGNTFITGGGAYGQLGLGYLDQAGLSALYLTANNGAFQIQSRFQDAGIVDASPDALTTHHDFFFVQLSVEPQSGTLCFGVVGILGPGTIAGSYYVSTQMIPNRANYPKSWYVFEWTDTNNDGIPMVGDDAFTMIASGP
jgi:hypothetical protein